jgi:3-oxoacyl-[acyl-carrier protein] reductase
VGVDTIINHIKHEYTAIDGMVINAGGPPPGRALTMSRDQWIQAVQTNFLAGVKLCKGIVPAMVEQTYGRVVAITSTSVKEPMINLVLSNSVRLGLIGYLRTLANEVGESNILINVVCPGPTKTQRLDNILESIAKSKNIPLSEEIASRTSAIPLKRFGEPHELADLVTYLISGRNTYITGQVIAVDGGQTNMIF